MTVWQAALNSLRTALDATLIALVVGGLVALVVSRRPRRAAARRAVAGLDALFMLPLGVSAVTVGFGFLLSMHQPFGLPVDLRTLPAARPDRSGRRRRAARGAHRAARAAGDRPAAARGRRDPRRRAGACPAHGRPSLARRAVGLAVGFAFAASLGEFGATSFLARPDSPTLPVVIFRLIGRPGADSYGQALAASVLLALLTAHRRRAASAARPPETEVTW